MRISIDGRASTLYRGTGIGNYTYQILKNINEIDHSNNYELYISKNSELDLNLNSNFNLNYSPEVQKSNFWNDIKAPNKISLNSDIYHTPQNGIGILEHTDIPQIITLHDIIPLKMPETVSSNYIKIFDTEMPKVLENTTGIITVSNFSKEDIHKTLNFPKDKIFVTHLAAESQYKVLDKNYCKKFLADNYNLTGDFILYVGGFSPRKNIIGLIESFSLIESMLPSDFRLVIVGHKGLSYEIYKKRAIDLNVDSKVIFTGFIEIEHMPIFYNGASMLVYPSFYEGFGLPPLEAMASGTPVVTSNITSIPEVVENAALSINPFDCDDIASAIKQILFNKEIRDDLIQKGLNQSQKYTWEKTACETINAYKKIIG